MYPQQTNEELCSSERDVNFGIGAKLAYQQKNQVSAKNCNVGGKCKDFMFNIENLRQRLIPITNESVNDCENNRKEEEIPNTPLGNSIRKISDTVRSEILLVKNIISLLEI